MYHLYKESVQTEFTVKEIDFEMAESTQNTLQITGNITVEGPIINVEVFKSLEDLRAWHNNKTLVKFHTLSALIDTGADISSLHTPFIDDLNLDKIEGGFKGQGIGGVINTEKAKCIVYRSIFRQIGLPLNLIGRDFSNENFKAILGRDFLRYFTLIYDGWSNSFRLINVNV